MIEILDKAMKESFDSGEIGNKTHLEAMKAARETILKNCQNKSKHEINIYLKMFLKQLSMPPSTGNPLADQKMHDWCTGATEVVLAASQAIKES